MRNSFNNATLTRRHPRGNARYNSENPFAIEASAVATSAAAATMR
jgi:hypothetical protein